MRLGGEYLAIDAPQELSFFLLTYNFTCTISQKCDGFMAASTKTDPELNTVNIPHEGAEEYRNLWQKFRSMMAYVYDNYYEKVSNNSL